MRPSLMRATVTSPCAFAGAAFDSQVASPRVAATAPSGAVTVTANRRRVVRRRGVEVGICDLRGPASALGPAAIRLVRFDDRLNELVAHDVTFVEVNEL